MQHANPSAQWTTFLPDQPSRWSLAEFETFLARARWVFARTMPDNPHDMTIPFTQAAVSRAYVAGPV